MVPRSRRLVISIHDVMPHTLTQTEAIVDRLHDAGLHVVTLLVVPGKDWSPERLERLGTLLDRGAVAAGHGWTHRADTIRGLYHQVHSAVLSRDAAEHLSLKPSEIRALIDRCYTWFEQHGLDAPALYVPPAWAMGPISKKELDQLPFVRYEVLSGVYDSIDRRFRCSPMIGFEADTRFRSIACRAWNRANLAAAGNRHPVRVAIHPGDFSLMLADDLARMIDAGGRALGYEVFGGPGSAADDTATEPRADSQ